MLNRLNVVGMLRRLAISPIIWYAHFGDRNLNVDCSVCSYYKRGFCKEYPKNVIECMRDKTERSVIELTEEGLRVRLAPKKNA